MLYQDIEDKLLAGIRENDPYSTLKKFYIQNWIRSHWVFLTTGGLKGLDFISKIFLDESCWETIDTLKKLNLNRYIVAKKLITSIVDGEKNPFDNLDRYRIACSCCLEDDIPSIFNKLDNSLENSHSLYKLIESLNYGNLMIFWSHVINELEERLLSKDQSHLYLYGFKCAIEDKQIEALEFFWNKIQLIRLSSGQKEELLIQVALYKSINGLANANMIGFCLNYLDSSKYYELLKQDFDKNGYYSTLHTLRAENFLESAEMLSGFLKQDQVLHEKKFDNFFKQKISSESEMYVKGSLILS